MQEKLNRLLKNRGGAVLAGVLAALVAVILLVVYLHSYRSSVDSGKRPVRVLVATKLIPRGTSATLIAQQGLYQVTTVDKDQLQLQAILDPAAIQDRVAATDILPGQQLTQADFTTESPQSIPYEISGAQRAIADSDRLGARAHRPGGRRQLRRHLCRRVRCHRREPRQASRLERLRSRRTRRRLGQRDPSDQHAGRGEVRLRDRQRAAVVHPAASGWSEADSARDSYAGDYSRKGYDRGLERWPNRSRHSSSSTRVSTQTDIERALPRGEEVEVVGQRYGIDEAWVRLHEVPNDLLIVVCAGQSESGVDASSTTRSPSARGGRSSCSRTARRTDSPGASSRPAPTTSSMLPVDPRRGAVRASEGDRPQGRRRGGGARSAARRSSACSARRAAPARR